MSPIATGRSSLSEKPRKRWSLKIEAVAPISADAGAAAEQTIRQTRANRARLMHEPRAEQAPAAARAIAAGDRALQSRTGVNRAADPPVGHERQLAGPPPLPDERGEAADMRRGKRASIDEKPSSPRLRRRDAPTGGNVDVAGSACKGMVRNGDHPRNRCRESAVGPARVVRRDDDGAARQPGFDQSAQKPIVGSAEAEIDHVGLLRDRKVERLGEAESVADRRSCRPALLPAGAQAEQPGIRSDARDADPVAALGGNDSGDRGPVLLRHLRLSDDEIAV